MFLWSLYRLLSPESHVPQFIAWPPPSLNSVMRTLTAITAKKNDASQVHCTQRGPGSAEQSAKFPAWGEACVLGQDLHSARPQEHRHSARNCFLGPGKSHLLGSFSRLTSLPTEVTFKGHTPCRQIGEATAISLCGHCHCHSISTAPTTSKGRTPLLSEQPPVSAGLWWDGAP